MPDAVAQSLVGKKVGKYKLTRCLGSGATADVYAGVDRAGTNVAVKVLIPAGARDSETLERFKREADAARRVDHPHVIEVFEVGAYRGRHYIVMELMRGGSLRDLLQRRRARPKKVITALAQVADALARAHEQGVVHRDLKPANVLLNRVGKSKLADFGLARNPDTTTLTTDGRMLGTATYMSPEQARGRRAMPASDVYSLGVMLYEAISGNPPFASETPYGLIYQHVELAPAKPRIRRGYPRSLARMAIRCLTKEPDGRPPMQEVAATLRRTANEMRLGHRPLWRRPRAMAIMAAATVAVIAGVVTSFPGVLDPLCGDGSGTMCALQRAAQHAHDTVVGW